MEVIKGSVVDMDSKSPYAQSIVNLTYVDAVGRGHTERQITTADGQFNFDISKINILPDTQMTLRAYDPNGVLSKAVKGSKEKLIEGEQALEMVAKSKIDQNLGKWYFFSLFALGLIMIIIYLLLHKNIRSEQLNLSTLLIHNLQDEIDSLGSRSDTDTSVATEDTLYLNEFIVRSSAHLRKNVMQAQRNGEHDSTFFSKKVMPLLNSVDTAITSDNRLLLKANLDQLQIYLAEKPSYIWSSAPLKWAEVMLWALFATILRLLLSAGFFLFRGTFKGAQIWNNMGLLIALPIIALLISFVLSFIKFSFSVGTSGLVLDLRNPELAVVLAVLIGLAPWTGWHFLRGLSASFFGWLDKMFPSQNEEDATEA